MNRAHALIALSTFAFMACTSDSDGSDATTSPDASDTSGTSGLALADLAAAKAKAICTHMVACCTAEDLQSELSWLPTDNPTNDQASCEQNVQLHQNYDVSLISQGLAANRVAYDGDKAAACVAAIGALGCANGSGRMGASFGDGIPSCQTYRTPLVENGNACWQPNECKSDFCTGKDNQEGVCAPKPARGTEGQTCDGVGPWTNSTCAEGLWCGGSHTCLKEHGHGEACDDGVACVDPGDYCDHATVCTTLKVDGTACDDDGACASGGCNVDNTTQTLVCGPSHVCTGK